MSLYQLTEAYRTVRDNDDLDPQVMADTLDSIKDPMKDKIDNIAWVIDQLNSDAKTLRDKSKSFAEVAHQKENKAKWLKQYLTDSLDAADIKKLQTENHLINVRNFKASTVIDDEDELPHTFIQKATITTPDKKLIYKALKDGATVPGAHLKPNRGVTIK